MEQLVRVDAVARALDVSIGTVQEWTRRGMIPAVRLARNVVRYDLTQVLDSVAGKVGSRGDAK